jgi:hypothetical protein
MYWYIQIVITKKARETSVHGPESRIFKTIFETTARSDAQLFS